MQANLLKASQPPPKKKDDFSDELSKLFDDGTILESERSRHAGANDTRPTPPHPTPPQVTPDQIVLASNKKVIEGVAPTKDFNRRANSLERDALPSGLFPGTSKKLYDALYLRTRGAVNPKRTIRARKKEMMIWSGIGSENTMDAHLRHFLKLGLLKRTFDVGDNAGATYEVMIPEELPPHPTPPHLTSGQATPPQVTAPQLTSEQNLGQGSPQIMGWGEVSHLIDSKSTSAPSKTIIKTKDIDDDETETDETFAGLNQALREAALSITGKVPTKIEREQWKELGNFLAAELKIAAARTTVSSVPAFFTEHLRRRLWKIDKKNSGGEGKVSSTETSVLTGEQISQCPDCKGTGFYYPMGYENGVAKCKHERANLANERDKHHTTVD